MIIQLHGKWSMVNSRQAIADLYQHVRGGNQSSLRFEQLLPHCGGAIMSLIDRVDNGYQPGGVHEDSVHGWRRPKR